MAPALLSYVLQTSLLIMLGTRKPFFRAAGTMILQSCQPVSMHCDLHHGESPCPLPMGATDLLGNGILQHLSKRHCTIRSVGAPRANLGTADPVARSSCCSEHNISLRYGRRLCSLRSYQGYVLQEMGFRMVADLLANSQL